MSALRQRTVSMGTAATRATRNCMDSGPPLNRYRSAKTGSMTTGVGSNATALRTRELNPTAATITNGNVTAKNVASNGYLNRPGESGDTDLWEDGLDGSKGQISAGGPRAGGADGAWAPARVPV